MRHSLYDIIISELLDSNNRLTDKKAISAIFELIQASRGKTLPERVSRFQSSIRGQNVLSILRSKAAAGQISKHFHLIDGFPKFTGPLVDLVFRSYFKKLKEDINKSISWGKSLSSAEEVFDDVAGRERHKNKLVGRARYVADNLSEEQSAFHEYRRAYGGGVQGAKLAREKMHNDKLKELRETYLAGTKAFNEAMLSDAERRFSKLVESFGGSRLGTLRAKAFLRKEQREEQAHKNSERIRERSYRKWEGKRNFAESMRSEEERKYREYKEAFGGGEQGARFARMKMRFEESERIKKEEKTRRESRIHSKRSGLHNYLYDQLDDYDAEMRNLRKRYGGGEEGKNRAEKAMRDKVFKGFPQFFKDSKISTKAMYELTKSLRSNPLLSSLGLSKFIPLLSSSVGAFAYGFNKVKSFSDSAISTSDKISRDASNAELAGMSYSDYLSKGSTMARWGGKETDLANFYSSWNSFTGGITRGSSNARNLGVFAKWGVSTSGSGSNGLATPRELISNIAARIKSLSRAEQLAMLNELPVDMSGPLRTMLLTGESNHIDAFDAFFGEQEKKNYKESLFRDRYNLTSKAASELQSKINSTDRLNQGIREYFGGGWAGSELAIKKFWHNVKENAFVRDAADLATDPTFSILSRSTWEERPLAQLMMERQRLLHGESDRLDSYNYNSYGGSGSNIQTNTINVNEMKIETPNARVTGEYLLDQAGKGRAVLAAPNDPGFF